jgi:hypothetical protein
MKKGSNSRCKIGIESNYEAVAARIGEILSQYARISGE